MEPSVLLIDNAAPGEIEDSSALSIDNNKNQPSSSPTRELSASTMQRTFTVALLHCIGEATGVAATSSASGDLDWNVTPPQGGTRGGLTQLKTQSFAVAVAFYI